MGGTEINAATSLGPPAPRDSGRRGRVQGDDRNGTLRDCLAPEPAERVIPHPRRSTREVAEPAASSEPGKVQTAGCGWFRWEESARSVRA
jgi:hypothetical protein